MSDQPDGENVNADAIKSSRKEIFEALLRIKKEIGVMAKDEKNQYGGWKYAGIDQYYEKVAPIALANGIHWVVNLDNYQRIRSLDGEKEVYLIDVSVDLYYSDGTVIIGYQHFPMESPLMGAHTTGSVVSYADKVFMRSVFKIASGEGDAEGYDNGYGRQNAKKAWRAPENGRKVAHNSAPAQTSTSEEPRTEEDDDRWETALKGKVNAHQTVSLIEGEWVGNKRFLNDLQKRDPVRYERIRLYFAGRKNTLAKRVPTSAAKSASTITNGKTTPPWTGGMRPAKTISRKSPEARSS